MSSVIVSSVKPTLQHQQPAKPMVAHTKLTPQQEDFAREYVACGIGIEAYRRAYKTRQSTKKSTLYTEASKLIRDPRIARRVRELQDNQAEVTMGELVSGLRQSRDVALEDRQPAAATTAVLGLAKLKGFLKDDPTKAGDVHIHFDALIKGVL